MLVMELASLSLLSFEKVLILTIYWVLIFAFDVIRSQVKAYLKPLFFDSVHHNHFHHRILLNISFGCSGRVPKCL